MYFLSQKKKKKVDTHTSSCYRFLSLALVFFFCFKALPLGLAIYSFVCLFTGPRHVACGISVPRPGIRPTPPALEVRSLNHWTAREVPRNFFLFNAKANT